MTPAEMAAWYEATFANVQVTIFLALLVAVRAATIPVLFAHVSDSGQVGPPQWGWISIARGSSVVTDGPSEEVAQLANLRAPILAKEHAASATGTRP
jgi:hypothetical protein